VRAPKNAHRNRVEETTDTAELLKPQPNKNIRDIKENFKNI